METSLYRPVKRFLEARGFAVKGEVCGCDLVAVPVAAANGADRAAEGGVNGAGGDAAGEPPLVVIGELKQRFSLELVLQGVDRMAAGDEIWLAVSTSGGGGRKRRGRERDPRVRKLCRLLGFGLLGVSARGLVEVLAEPGPWRPRKAKWRRARLVDEHRRRRGDPAVGGTAMRLVPAKAGIMTAYRQQALAVAAALAADAANGTGTRRPRDLKAVAPDAPKILLHNVYGWFMRVERGVYALTEAGRAALVRWAPP
jgi:hypothetical protein